MRSTTTNFLIAALCGGAAMGCSHSSAKRTSSSAKTNVVHPASSMPSGVDMQYVDPRVSLRDDFYRHLHGKWLDTFEIPADHAHYGLVDKLRDDADAQVRVLIEDSARAQHAPGSGPQKIGDLYASVMDEPRLEKLGIAPLATDLARIDELASKDQIPALIAMFQQTGVTTPFGAGVHQDNKDSTKYVVGLGQWGLGLPDRDYYLKDDDAKLHAVRDKYLTHIATMMKLAGDAHPAATAKYVLALETELAKVQWTEVENRDPIRRYNKIPLTDLPALAPGFDWKRYLTAAKLDGRIGYVIVSQPSYLTGFAKLLSALPLPAWKAYFKWHLVSDSTPLLSKAFVDEAFAFRGTVVSGVPQLEERWQRGVHAVERMLGEEVGKLYVAKFFPPENKKRMEKLIGNLLEAYRRSIDGLDWMSPSTKAEAKAKLAKLTLEIGYPTKWRDYSTLEIEPDDLYGNFKRSCLHEYDHDVDKLGKPIDRSEWIMTPQTVNAYNDVERNELAFPAALLQPPLFDAKADDAANYGGIGALIGHEISHGFDDEGSQYDGEGNLRNWFTPDDLARFKAKTRQLVAQYGKFAPVPGHNVNGELTLGENIADNAGLAIAYEAYELSLGGAPSPMIDGTTGEQRFYLGWAQIWRDKMRELESIRIMKVDPHSPAQLRANGALVNQPGFYAAFGIDASNKMFVPPAERVVIW